MGARWSGLPFSCNESLTVYSHGLKYTLLHSADVGARSLARPLGVSDRTVGVTRAEDCLHTLGRIRRRRLRGVGAHINECCSSRQVSRIHAALGLSILGETARAGTLISLPAKRRKGIRDQIIDEAARTRRRYQCRAGAVELLGVAAAIEPRTRSG